MGPPITGRVVDPEGNPLAGSAVTCEGASDRVDPVDSDADGRFVLTQPVENCRAVARHPRYVRSAAVPASPGVAVELRLRRGGSIEGVLLDAKERVVSPAMLYIASFTTAAPGSPDFDKVCVVTDPEGAVVWTGLPPGRFEIVASSAGQPTATVAEVDVKEGEATRGVRLVFPPAATLAARVVDAHTNARIAGASVSLASVAGRPFPPQTNAAGEVNVLVPGGGVAVTVVAGGFKTRTVEFAGGAPGSTYGETIALEAEAPPNP